MTTVTEFAAAIVIGNDNLNRLQSAVNDAPGNFTTSAGTLVPNLRKRLEDIGYMDPVPFISGLSATDASFTVTYLGATYSANSASIPFVTTGVFNPAQWVRPVFLDEAEAARDEAVLYGGVQVDTLPDLYALTSGQVAVGQWVLVRSTGWAYQRAADAAVDADVVPPDSVLKFYGRGATDVRKNANLGTAINFFDFLMDGYTDGDRASIALGTYMGDLSVPWVAFRDALAVEAAAGRRPHGVIPQCTIRTSVSPNFAMNFLTLETYGTPHIIGTGTNNGINIDGRDLGMGGFGVRGLDIGNLSATSVAGTYGWFVTWCHMSDFWRMESQGAVFASFGILACVTSTFRPLSSAQMAAWITRPQHGCYVSRIGSGVGNSPTSWCYFSAPKLEYTLDSGIFLDWTYGNMFLSGTSEAIGTGGGGGLGRGIVLTENARFNKLIGIDFEQNIGYNIYCLGSNNEFIGVDSGGAGAARGVLFEGAAAFGNKITGGYYSYITVDVGVKGTSIVSAMVGTLADSTTGANRTRTLLLTDASGNWKDVWTAYTPTIAASSGTFTTTSTSGSYKIFDGDTVHFRAEVVITTNGTAAGGILLGLPFPAQATSVCTGVEIAATGKQVGGRALAAGNTMLVRFSDGTYPGANGYTISISGTYQRQ